MSGGPPLPHKMVPTFKFIQNMSKRHHGTTLDPLPLDMTSEASLEKKSQEDPPSLIQWYHTLAYTISNIYAIIKFLSPEDFQRVFFRILHPYGGTTLIPAWYLKIDLRV